jgi:hypothetical protein
MKILLTGLAVMAFVWAVQAQAAEVTCRKDIKPIFDTRCADPAPEL